MAPSYVLASDNLDRRGRRIIRGIERTRLKLMRSVHRSRHTPRTCVRRCRVCALQRAVNQKLHTRYTNVITCRSRDRYVRLAGDVRVVRGRRDRHRWSDSVASLSEADPVHGARATREVVEKTIR